MKTNLSSRVSIPQGLDAVASEWRKYISSNVTINMTQDLTGHVDGMSSIYHMTIAFQKPEGPLVMHYAGQTKGPGGRASKHKSELKTCKTTTYTGKSVLYCDKYFESVSVIDMHFRVHTGNLTKDEAGMAEEALADELKRLYGEEAVLTRPRNKQQKA